MQLIQVLYRKGTGGPVDDVTLDELIQSRKISHFYRPSEGRWVDISVDPVRGRGPAHGPEGLRRRYTDKEVDNEQGAREEKSGGLLRSICMRLKKRAPRKMLSAEGWLERGLLELRAKDHVGAARAFAKAVRLNPRRQEAYLHRGLVYEAMGNLEQAIEDYSMAVALDPKEGKPDYPLGLVLGRPQITVKAIAGLRRTADLQRADSRTVLASPAELRRTLETPTEQRLEGKVSGEGAEGTLEGAGDLQRLIDKYKKELTQLEAQFQGVRHKHGILVEAARLLEEEALIPHRTLYEKLSDAHSERS